ncbi:RNA-directed DNA polymerase [Abeliophyllum distichum]|uniref:RNA-directed DNA polymerase n=1 Tax=Abeliophyllum distichum TaxID=126358 RepID=A0ABD1RU22_9LAMI
MWTPPNRRHERKYCKFHRDHGHDTEDCHQLKEEIERLIKRGHLSKFVKADKEKGKEAEYRQQPPPRVGVINVIVGGIAVGDSVVIMTSFLLVKAPMAYNVIYGHPLLNGARVVFSTYHQVMKFPTSRGVGCVRGDKQASRRCYVDSILIKNMIMMLDLEQPNRRIELFEITEDVVIAEGRVVKIGAG